jgi:hypothetical protein
MSPIPCPAVKMVNESASTSPHSPGSRAGRSHSRTTDRQQRGGDEGLGQPASPIDTGDNTVAGNFGC